MSLTISEIKNLKQEYGFSNEWVAEKSGVPLGTVQKIFSEQVKSPRKATVDKLSDFFEQLLGYKERDASMVHEAEVAYKAIQKNKVTYRTLDNAIQVEDGVYKLKNGKFTIEDLEFIPDDKRMELIDGVLYDMAAPYWDHQRIIRDVGFQIYSCIVKNHKDCEVLFAPFDVQVDLSKFTMVQPDLIILCGHKDDHHRFFKGAPDFVMEVLSKSTRKKDMTVKLTKYWNSGVREYWIADQKDRKVIVYDFEHDDLDHAYTFDDKVPVGISDGKCEVDFSIVSSGLQQEVGKDW